PILTFLRSFASLWPGDCTRSAMDMAPDSKARAGRRSSLFFPSMFLSFHCKELFPSVFLLFALLLQRELLIAPLERGLEALLRRYGEEGLRFLGFRELGKREYLRAIFDGRSEAANIVALVDALLVQLHGRRRNLHQLARQLVGLREKRVGGTRPVDQADPFRDFGIDPPAGEQQLLGALHRHYPRHDEERRSRLELD